MNVEIRTGSDSDIKKIKDVYSTLDDLSITYTARVLSAHRNTGEMITNAKKLRQNGFGVCIAAAGGSAHLPGMTASETTIPVMGIPVNTKECDGEDSYYSMVQMPEGIPTGVVGVGQAKQAAQVTSRILSVSNAKSIGIQVLSGKPNDQKLQAMKKLIAELGLHEATDANVLILISDLKKTEQIKKAVQSVNSPCILLPVNVTGKQLFAFFQQYKLPLVCTGINRYQNAALYAAQIASLTNENVRKKLDVHRKELAKNSQSKDALLGKKGISYFLQ